MFGDCPCGGHCGIKYVATHIHEFKVDTVKLYVRDTLYTTLVGHSFVRDGCVSHFMAVLYLSHT